MKFEELVQRIKQERERQKSLGHTSENDKGYKQGVLEAAGICYIATAITGEKVGDDVPPAMWPFQQDVYKPSGDYEKDLVKGLALIFAGFEAHQEQEPMPEGE